MGVTAFGCVVVRQLAAQALLRGRPGGVPMVVMEGARPSERVYAMNGAARALGVAAGMTRVEVETFGEVEMRARSRGEEAAARDMLRACMGRFSPRVEERGEGVDWECVLDLSGTERLLGTAEVVGRALLEAVRDCGFQARVVLCANADAGLSLGRVGTGLQVVAEGAEAAALARLPVGVLGLEEEEAERFAVWGIGTLGELAKLPEVQLIARMGQAGRTLRLRARGELPHHLEPVEEMVRLEETMEFDDAVETLEPLLFCMNGMLERMLAQALERTLALATVTVMLWLERCGDRVAETVVEEEAEQAVERAPERLEDEIAVLEEPWGAVREDKRDDTLEERVGRYGKLPEQRAMGPHARGLLGAQIHRRLNGRAQLAGAEDGVRRSWQSQALRAKERAQGVELGDTQRACPSGKVDPSYGEAEPLRQVSEARMGMASADAAVRKAWHRAALLGEAVAAKDVPPVRGEIAARRGLGIGDGQAMRRAIHQDAGQAEPRRLTIIARAEVNAGPAVPQAVIEVEAKTDAEEGKWGKAFERTVRPAIATVDRLLLLKMLQLDLEAHSPEGAVVRMRLVGEAGAVSRIQLGLFAPPLPEPTRFDDTHARLVSVAGEGNVGRVRALDTHAPECFVLERFCLPTGMRTKPGEIQAQGAPAMALRRMRPPADVRVMLAATEIARFWMDGMRFDVERCFGPWRGSGAWWGSGVWSADAWDVAGRGEDGELLVCLLSRDILRDRWMVEGIYD